MSARKRKRTALPRITLMAYSRRDLLDFVAAVESLRCIAADLAVIAATLDRAARSKARGEGRKAVVVNGELATDDSQGEERKGGKTR